MKLSPEYQAIWEKVQENKKRLESCPGPHEFKPVDASSPAARIGRQVCAICGGEVDAVNAIWYRHGLEDANKAEQAKSETCVWKWRGWQSTCCGMIQDSGFPPETCPSCGGKVEAWDVDGKRIEVKK